MNTHSIKLILVWILALGAALACQAVEKGDGGDEAEPPLSLITADVEEGFQLAITLSRKGVTETQPDREVLFQQREVYSRDADSLIAASQVVAIHFQTIAAANDYWRDE